MPPRVNSPPAERSWRIPETWDYTLYIPNDLRAVTICRRTLRLILTMHGLIGLVDTAELLATELVSNAVRHTKGPAALRVRRSPEGVVWIGAWDTDPGPPEPPRDLEQVAALEEEGRGLGLVRACADYWGWQPSARFGNRGKFVWCELGAA
ncbi:ATP-binding protein [Streptomyces sp. NPDC001165]|uniref:ATP-binding protein n=1 Tax=Streptomyces sp. NPDC001165 TaxID=3364546 RepID=UPI0036C4569E